MCKIKSLRETARERSSTTDDRASWAPLELSCSNKYTCTTSTVSRLTLTPKMNTLPVETLSAWAVSHLSNPLFCSMPLYYQCECSLPPFLPSETMNFPLWPPALLIVRCFRWTELDINYWRGDETVLSFSLRSDFVIIWRRWARLAAINLIQLFLQPG